jgi:hypothetical protein
VKITLRGGKPASEESIQALEHLIGCTISESVRAFVRIHDGAEPESNILRISHNDDLGVRAFIPMREIPRQRAYIENVPPHGYPIAYDSCGNFVLVDEGRKGVVVFWNHELPDDMITLATDFAEFLEQLQPFDQSSVKLEPGQVKSVWIDPEFLKKLKQR